MRKDRPSFRVKHPYQNLISSMLMGLVLLLSAVLSVFIINNATGRGEVAGVNAVDVTTWSALNSNMQTSGAVVNLKASIDISSADTTWYYWKGKLNGNGYTIRFTNQSTTGFNIVMQNGCVVDNVDFYMYYSVETSNDNVFFESIQSGATLSNCTIRFASENSYPFIYSNGGTITNCKISGNTYALAKTTYYGVLTSYNSGTITKCSRSGTIYRASSSTRTVSTSYIASFVGSNSGTISQCYNTGTVYGAYAYSS